MKFSQEFIERVREANNLVDIVGQYVQLRRTGGNHQGLCPFHNEKSPSFSVSEDKQVYHCFGCKASGNVLTFVQNYQGLTFPEAIEFLAARAAIPIPEASREESGAKDSKQTLFKVNALAAQFYQDELQKLPLDHPVRQYVDQRGLNDDLVKAYRIGYAPEAWGTLTQFFQNKRVPIACAEQLGLLKKRTGGKDGHYDLFRHRVMFPIFSPTGQCLGFGGRVLSKEQQPKYLNSPDSPIFHKGKVFYGLDHSAKFIRTEDEVIVVEGYMDWLALAKVSINNAVATLGTALTADHAKVVRRYTQRVLLLFDGDQAGRAAARRSLPILLAEGLHARGLFLPNNQDPDDFIKAHGAPELRKLLSAAPDLFDLVSTDEWVGAKGIPTGKVQLLDTFAPILAQAQDVRLRRLYAENLANMLDVSLRLVEQSVAKIAGATARGSGPGVSKPVGTPRPVGSPVPSPTESASAAPPSTTSPGSETLQFDLSKVPRAELDILNLILARESHLKTTLAAEIGRQFSHPDAGRVFERITEAYRLNPSKFASLSALLANEVRPAEMITRHLTEPYTGLGEDSVLKLLQDCIKRVRQTYLRSKSKELVSSLRGAGPVNSAEQLEQIMNIHKSRQSLSRDS